MTSEDKQIQPATSNLLRDPLPRSAFRGELQFGDVKAECHVLEDGRAVLTTRGIVQVLVGHDNGNLKQYLSRIPGGSDLLALDTEIRFRLPAGGVATGRTAEFVIDVCGLYIDAMARAKLKPRQMHIAINAVLIQKASGKVGLISLVHEATGYQRFRAERALQEKMQLLLADEASKWQPMYSAEFWRDLAKLYRLPLVNESQRPGIFGAFLWEFIYEALDKDIARRLRELNPDPHFRSNHHQFFTTVGRDRLARHIRDVHVLVKSSGSIDEFRGGFNATFRGAALQLPLPASN